MSGYVADEGNPRIKVLGIGTAAVNILGGLSRAEIGGSELIALDTDRQYLSHCPVSRKIYIDPTTIPRRGFFCQLDPALAAEAAWRMSSQIRQALEGADLLILISCLGGGSGTGITPPVASIARELGVFTIALITTPFRFEGPRRQERAWAAMGSLLDQVDSLVHIPHQGLLRYLSPHTIIKDALEFSSRVIEQVVKALVSPLIQPLCIDFSDLLTSFWQDRIWDIAIGSGKGEERLLKALGGALGEEGLLVGGAPLREASSIWICMEGGDDLYLSEINECVQAIAGMVQPDTDIVFSPMIKEDLRDTVRITLLAGRYDPSGCGPAQHNFPYQHNRTVAQERKEAEEQARALLQNLLPDQARQYRERNFIELPSRLYKDRYYRIHGGWGSYKTEVVEGGKVIARCCLILTDPFLPPTDRVLAEYFLIRGAEEEYLQTANILKERAPE